MESRRNILLVIGAIIFVVILVVVALIIKNATAPFKMTGTTPDISKPIASSTSSIVVNFNKPLNKDFAVAREIESNGIVQGVEVRDKSIILNLRILNDDQEYLIIIKRVVDSKGAEITNIRLDFTAKYIPFNQLSEEEQKQQIDDTDPEPKNPTIVNFLPYETPNYKLISGTATDNKGNKKTVVVVKDLFIMGLDPPYPAEEIASIGKTITTYLKNTKIARDTYWLLSDNPTLAKDINADTLPAGYTVVTDDFTGDGNAPPN